MAHLETIKKRKAFCLGIGAQKAGSSWLHYYLGHDPAVRTGPHKEYRVWDAIDLPLFRSAKVPLRLDAVRREPLRFLMQRFPRLYFLYFARLLTSPEVSLAADISPTYAALSAGRLSMIRGEFARRGIDCRLIFLMREPVERCASLVRMWKDRASRGESVPHGDFLDLRAYCRTGHARALTNYDQTLRRIEETFEPRQIHLDLYEQMFDEGNVAALSEFCGIRCDPTRREHRVNSGGLPGEPTERDYSEIAPLYRHAYEAVASRFPQAVALWKGFRYL